MTAGARRSRLPHGLNTNNRDTFNLHGDIYDEGTGKCGSHHLRSALFAGRQFTARFPLEFDRQWKRSSSAGDDLQLEAYVDRTNRQEANFSDIRNTFDVDFLEPSTCRDGRNFPGPGARASKGDDKPVITGLEFLPAIERTNSSRDFLTMKSASSASSFAFGRNKTLEDELYRISVGAERPPAMDSDCQAELWAAFTMPCVRLGR